jgi:nickel-dependent lactate racemase
MEVKIPYAGELVDIELPVPKRQLTVLKSEDPSPDRDMEGLVEKALRNPIGKAPLGTMVRKGDRIAILFDDWTRPTPVFSIMPVVLAQLKRSGIQDDDIILICANGTHAPEHMNHERMAEKLGKAIFENFRVISHDAYDEGTLLFLGETKCLKTPLFVNKVVMEKDIRIAIGRIAPHGEVGYSGGAKMIMPGVSSIWSVMHHHSGSYPRRGVLANPLRRDIDECGRMARLDFIVNVVSNSKEEVVRVFAGDPVLSFREGVSYGDREVWGSQVERTADIVLVSPGLHKDSYFIPSMRVLGVALRCLKRGGTVIVASSCHGGWSEPSFLERGWHPTRDLLEYDYPSLLRLVASRTWHEPHRQFQALVYYVHHIARTCFRNHVILAGSKGFSKDDARKLQIQVEGTLQNGVNAALERQGKKARIIVIPDAFTLPLPRTKR